MTQLGEVSGLDDLFDGGGEMGELMRSLDWSTNPLGPVAQWHQSLKTAVRIMLTSRQAMFVWWGEELVNLYNDAYKAILGGKHPEVLGQPASYVWREIWDQVGPRAESAMLRNEGTYDEALLLIMERNGYPEETYYTFSYSPVPNDQGGTGGIICANTDDTQRIIGERQLSLLRDLAAGTADARTFDEACTRSADCLKTNPYDLPFAMIYLVDPNQERVFLAGTAGIERDHAAAPDAIALNAGSAWSFAAAIKTQKTVLVTDLAMSFSNLPTGAWQQAPHQAAIVPIAPSGQTGKGGILVVGLNPFRLFDDNYQGFIDLAAAQIAASIANAQAYEEERKRAEVLAELDRAKTIFFSNISHEFRTPLTLMLGPLEDALSSLEEQEDAGNQEDARTRGRGDAGKVGSDFSSSPPLPFSPSPRLPFSVSSLREQLQVAHRNSLRLLKLVNTLLDFSRIEAGRIQAVYEPTDLAILTADLAGVFRSAIERAGMRLKVDCLPLPEPIYVDREMWEKIVLNLLSNAFKFTFEGEITVTLRWCNDWEEDTEIEGRGQEAEGRGQEAEGRREDTEPRRRGHTENSSSVQNSKFKIQNSEFSPPPPFVILEVRDTGTGISAIEIPRLFERFHRVEGAKGRTYEGSGIGLSLVQELVNLHGGTIHVSSVVDQGSCFTIAIPAGCAHIPGDRIRPTRTLDSTAVGAATYVEEALRWLPQEGTEKGRRNTETLSPELPASPRSLPASPLPSARILLADDNTDMRDYVNRLLVSQGYTVEPVENGAAALAAIRQQAPDLVLTDVMMPELDGLGLLRELRAEPQTREIPIILLSARAGEESRVEGLEAGADDYLIKPFSARELVARVEATLKLARLRREAMQQEQALRIEAQAAEANLERVLSSITDQFLTLDQEWRYTYVNDRVLEVSGMQKEDLLGKKIWELLPGVVGSQFDTEVRRAVAEQTVVQFEYFYPSWQRWFENRIYPSASGVSIFVTEITDRKLAEAALRQSEERYRYLTESIPQLVWTANAEGTLLDVNQRWLEFTGLTLGQAQIEGWQAIVHPEDVLILSQCWAAAQQDSSLYQAEGRMRRADGVYRWHLHQAVPLKDEFDQVIKWFGTATDIDDQKQLEQQRGLILQREQTAREAAERANRIKDEFLAVLSHELRSPLNPILGWSRLLQTQKLDEAKTAQALETIERNAKLQAELITDLLDVSRILQGKLSLDIAPVDLVSTIQSAIETVRLSAEAKSIEMRSEVREGESEKYRTQEPGVRKESEVEAAKTQNFNASPFIVSGSASRLQQVVWNLLSNAIKFTPEGGRVNIRLEPVQMKHEELRMKHKELGIQEDYNSQFSVLNSQFSYAQITVSDTGRGISPDFLPYVFDYFRQADATTTRKFGGLGLGLAIVRHLVELHGGTVQVESLGEGQGATFTVRLPLLQLESEQVGDELSDSLLLTSHASLLNDLRILIVDDDEDARNLAIFVLEQCGAKVTAVGSASGAFAALVQSQPDLLLSDIGMPDIDGFTLIKQVRKLRPEQGGQIPAIALTAYASEIDCKQALAAGFQAHIAKPFKLTELISVISSLVKRF